jgi:tRNA 2-thiouridine synthesizing protein A
MSWLWRALESMNLPSDAVLDAGRSGCGELLMLIFQKMKTLTVGQTLLVCAYDEVADIDISAWCRITGNPLIARDVNADPKQFLIQKHTESHKP